MTYIVEFEDNEGNDGRDVFNTESEAEIAILSDLDYVKLEFAHEHRMYDVADFGHEVEIWEPGGDKYVRWRRMWRK